MKIIEKIYDVQTDEETLIERDETPAEKLIREKLEGDIAAKALENSTKEAARKAILDKLGITEEEAKLLLS